MTCNDNILMETCLSKGSAQLRRYSNKQAGADNGFYSLEIWPPQKDAKQEDNMRSKPHSENIKICAQVKQTIATWPYFISKTRGSSDYQKYLIKKSLYVSMRITMFAIFIITTINLGYWVACLMFRKRLCRGLIHTSWWLDSLTPGPWVCHPTWKLLFLSICKDNLSNVTNF